MKLSLYNCKNSSKYHALFGIFFLLTIPSALFTAAGNPKFSQEQIDSIILEEDAEQLKKLHTSQPAALVIALEQLLDPKIRYVKKKIYYWMDTYDLDDPQQALRAKSFKRLLNVAGNTNWHYIAHGSKTTKNNSYLLQRTMVKLGYKKDDEDDEDTHTTFLKGCVHLLVQDKADVNLQPRIGLVQWPALELAYEYKRPDIAKTLLDAKADPTLHERFSMFVEGTDSHYNNFIADLQTAASVKKESTEKKVTSTKK